MVARVEPSYNVLALFKALKGDSSASTAAADAIIEQVRKINAAASNARMHGASVATEAWFSQADAESGEAWITFGDVDLTTWRPRFDNDAEYRIFTHGLADYNKDWSIKDSMLENRVELAKISYKTQVGMQGFFDRATKGGSQEVYDFIKNGDDIQMFSNNISRYNQYLSLLHDGEIFIAEKKIELSNATDEDRIKKINKDLEMVSGMIQGKQAFIDNFQTYLDYVSWSWQVGGYNLSGSLYKKNDDGTYSPGVFEITVKDGSGVYWVHDGNGIALRSNPFGTEYYKVDLLYAERTQKQYPQMAIQERLDSMYEKYPYRVVRDGRVMYSNKPAADQVPIEHSS